MQSSSKLFFITIFLVLLCGVLLFKGIEQELSKRSSATPIPTVSPLASAPAVLGEESLASSSAESDKKVSPLYKVEKVIDGDTIEVSSNDQKFRVRLIGVDTPETVDPNRPKGCFGKEASDETKRLLEGKSVILTKDVSETDKYQRLLRYVFLPINESEQLFVNDYLIREGFGTVLTYPPDVKFTTQFLQAQSQAKNEKRGLWGRCQN